VEEKLRNTLEMLEKAIAQAGTQTEIITAELANPFLKAEIRSRHKRDLATYEEIKRKLNQQITGLKKLGDISSAELEKLTDNRAER
jgi:NifB/MoaA-like Fe-S oxidoreductase